MCFSACGAVTCVKLVRLSSDAKNESSLLYTRKRDIHSVGIVFLQMLLGLDVMQRFGDVYEALRSCTLTSSLLCLKVLTVINS